MNDDHDDVDGNSGRPDDEKVAFRSSEILVLIGHLTNATVQHGNAIVALAAGDNARALAAGADAGNQIDEILEIFRMKLSEDAYIEQR